jgi:hypothetical protein
VAINLVRCLDLPTPRIAVHLTRRRKSSPDGGELRGP